MIATVILSVCLCKASRRAKRQDQLNPRAVENVYEFEDGYQAKKHETMDQQIFYDKILDNTMANTSMMKKPLSIPRAVSVYSVDWPY